jgi:hypothetical protein
VDDAIKRATEKWTTIHSPSPPKKAMTNQKPPIVLVIPFHPGNPQFQQAINQVWTKHEKI